MPLNDSPDSPLSDKQLRQHTVPVSNIDQVWPIAHIDAYREIVPSLVQLYDSLSAASGQSMFPDAIRERILEVLNSLSDMTQLRWEQYVKAAAPLPMQADALLEAGPPEYITYKGNYPFLIWLSEMDGPQLGWRQFHLRIEEDQSGEMFTLNAPFRPVSVDSLPKGTRKVLITDPVHAASIAVTEVISTTLADLQRPRERVSARDNWVRLTATSKFLQEVVLERQKDMSLDDYRDWIVSLPAKIDILNAPTIIAKHGANSVAIQVLAMRAISNFIMDAMDRAEHEPGNTSTQALVDQVFDELEQYLARISARTSTLNDLLIRTQDNIPQDCSIQVVSRPFPRGTPFIAIIPATGADSNVLPMGSGENR